MLLEWDPAKDAENVARRGFSFAAVEQWDWETAQTVEDTRKKYGERRFITVGLIEARLYVVVWTPRDSANPDHQRARRMREIGSSMTKRANPYLTDEDNPPLTADMVKRMRPAKEVFAELGIRYPGQRGPQRSPTKQMVAIRLDRDVVAALKASGPGWQTRANDMLKRSVAALSSPQPVRRSATKTISRKSTKGGALRKQSIR